VALDQVEAVRRHHHAVLLVVIRAPIEVVEPQPKPAIALGAELENLYACRDDFGADAIPRDGGDPILTHGRALYLRFMIEAARPETSLPLEHTRS
jgi:hypothetical protein